MVDAHSLLGPHPKKYQLLHTVEQDAPIAAQLVGEEPLLMRDAAHVLLEHVSVEFLDINSACPVKKVIKKGAGAALLQNPETLVRTISTLTSSLSIPITVKLRIGYHTVDIPALIDLVKACEASGASALFVHGRTRDQGYSGDINYEAIRAVKYAVNIPVFGSGNIFTPQSAKYMLDETDCDGILVARGAFGNPWIFRNIEEFLQTGTLPPESTLVQRKIVVKRHLSYIKQYKSSSPSGKLGFMRKVALWYMRGFPHASKIRGQINTIGDYDALVHFIDEQMRV
jgi:nifR3 family TIM-barrel protein